jgi:N-acetylmuramoyl-L-alanine amidase
MAQTVVIDPGHGGTGNVGGSDGNHATSPSGVLEKDMTLDIAQRVRTQLQAAAPNVKVVLTRTADVNLGLADRARVARENHAELFLSVHFNGFDGGARGVEAFVRPIADGNVNHAEDVRFARRVQQAVLRAIQARDPGTRDRGVKDMKLGVLSDVALGNTPAHHPCRACLLEIEFIDVPSVDELLNTGPQATVVRSEVSRAIADAIVEELAAGA